MLYGVDHRMNWMPKTWRNHEKQTEMTLTIVDSGRHHGWPRLRERRGGFKTWGNDWETTESILLVDFRITQRTRGHHYRNSHTFLIIFIPPSPEPRGIHFSIHYLSLYSYLENRTEGLVPELKTGSSKTKPRGIPAGDLQLVTIRTWDEECLLSHACSIEQKTRSGYSGIAVVYKTTKAFHNSWRLVTPTWVLFELVVSCWSEKFFCALRRSRQLHNGINYVSRCIQATKLRGPALSTCISGNKEGIRPSFVSRMQGPHMKDSWMLK